MSITYVLWNIRVSSIDFCGCPGLAQRVTLKSSSYKSSRASFCNCIYNYPPCASPSQGYISNTLSSPTCKARESISHLCCQSHDQKKQVCWRLQPYISPPLTHSVALTVSIMQFLVDHNGYPSHKRPGNKILHSRRTRGCCSALCHEQAYIHNDLQSKWAAWWVCQLKTYLCKLAYNHIDFHCDCTTLLNAEGDTWWHSLQVSWFYKHYSS